jgi:endonuclease/exonuclease/phosphatase family metal-dependent hydrolase
MGLKVMTYNCWGVDADDKRIEAIAEAVIYHDPDVVCLQEVVLLSHVDILQRHLLAAGYAVRCPPERFSLLNQGGLMTAIAVHHGYDATNWNFIPFPRQAAWYHPLTWSDKLLGKGALVATAHKDGAWCRIINTHLLGSYGKLPGTEEAIIRSQREAIVKWFGSLHGPAILCGDLNCPPSAFGTESPFRQWKEAFGLDKEEPYTVDNQRNPLRQGFIARLSGRGAAKPNKRIDYIFLRDGGLDVRFKDPKVILDYPVEETTCGFTGFLSDHYGILTEIA